MKEELVKLWKEYVIALKKENDHIANTEYKFHTNLPRIEKSFDSFIKWLDTARV